MRELFIKLFPKLGLQILYFLSFKKFYNIRNPITINEKLIWLNFNSKNPLKSLCADKYRVREYIKKLNLSNNLNQLYGVYNNANEIDFEKLPNQFVLKCNHGAGYNIICIDKSKFDIKNETKKLNKWLKKDYSLRYAEMHYKKMKSKIICEKYLGDNIDDYKVYCFHGEPKYIMLCKNRRKSQIKYYFYTFEWEYLNDLIEQLEDPHIKKPENIKEIYEFSKKLSKDFVFVRVDMYIVEGKIIFGELTFVPSGALDNETLPSVNIELGNLIKL